MTKFRTRPVVTEAEQWLKNGDVLEAKTFPIDSDSEWICKMCGHVASKHNKCPTLEGFHIVCPGDWIIKGIEGEFYPCKPSVFEKTYEKV